ncbi:MAG TPA: thioredoxin family protein [Acidimicrobiia bacterium]|nr:thioredoxin family protein [Acidimicrobiia bacterium]
MEITIQYFDGCPNWKTTAAHLSTLVNEGLDATISYELINTHELAVARDFHGSPTVLIEGEDPFADKNAPTGLACRMYVTDHGPAGSPSLSQLRHAIATAGKGAT